MSIMQSCILTYKPEYYIPHYGAKGLYRPFATDFSGYLCAYDRYPELINASSIDSMEIAYEKYKTNAVNYSIENGVQQNILLSQILIDYERCEFLKKSLPYAGKRFHEIKLNEHPFFVNKQFEMPYLITANGYKLSVNYEKIDLKYTPIDVRPPLEFYKISINTSNGKYYNWKRLEKNNLLNEDGVQYEHSNFYLSDSVYKESLQNLLVAVAVHPYSHNWGPRIEDVDIFYLSKAFYSYYISKAILYGMAIESIRDSTCNLSRWNRYIGLKAIKANRAFSYYPFHGNPQKLIPFIYIMSYGEYEPEDVFFEKKHFKQFYYTFNSLRDGKKYRLHYNARNGKFVNYKEINTPSFSTTVNTK